MWHNEKSIYRGFAMNKNEEIFKSVFGATWKTLPPVFQKRYMNRSFCNDLSSVEGKMDIHFSKLMAFFMPVFRLFHVLVPYQGSNIPVKVDFCSKMDSDGVYLERKFYFPGKPPYEFNSCMRVIKENDVVECMAFGMGWRTHYFFDGKKIVMQHKSYVLRLFGWNIPLPLSIFIGKGHAEEEMIDDNTYRMAMTMTHPLFGVLYRYAGDFTFTRLSS
jgi:hypothetical protein